MPISRRCVRSCALSPRPHIVSRWSRECPCGLRFGLLEKLWKATDLCAYYSALSRSSSHHCSGVLSRIQRDATTVRRRRSGPPRLRARGPLAGERLPHVYTSRSPPLKSTRVKVRSLSLPCARTRRPETRGLTFALSLSLGLGDRAARSRAHAARRSLFFVCGVTSYEQRADLKTREGDSWETRQAAFGLKKQEPFAWSEL